MLARALALWASDPDLSATWQEIQPDFARLRFSRGLRNGWEEARAEAAIWNAVHASKLLGSRVLASELRRQLADLEGAPSANKIAVAAWRMQSRIQGTLPPLNERRDLATTRHSTMPAPQLLSGLLLDWQATWETPEVPPRQEAFSVALALAEADAPAWLCSGLALAELWGAANPVLGWAFARWILCARGVEPTGVWALPDLGDARGNQLSCGIVPEKTGPLGNADWAQALAAYQSGTPEGVKTYLAWYLQVLAAGVAEGEAISQSILAAIPRQDN
ncbi:hypothetical protein BK816_00615 [Boudabousia tangfeifanii]|uniref:Fido domain-containing protein n=1 Tax=Boudabousia tangfeifanii TaxID=1912795 RepID=A0A1D9MIE4_9ACTO|nr:hypothetical protein [Boudabousia tangfeifanii]AOZ71978.1 hypothetical protein BK816_00615 [Boudabousia tangfeifanii]